MNIGIPKESRPCEYRVGLSPAGVQRLVSRGHTCYVEHDAGKFAGFSDHDYQQAGAVIVYSNHEAYARADIILKVTRPTEDELEMVQPGAIIGGALHLSAAKESKIRYMIENNITTVAYEQIHRDDDSRPVLRAMSEIGGHMTAQVAANLLQNNTGGKGILLGGAPGIPPAEVVIIGAGVFGSSAAQALSAVGAHLTVLDRSVESLQDMHYKFPQIVTMLATKANIRRSCAYADVVITAAAIPGDRAPILITREILKAMKLRAIIIDASIDEGGCLETSRPTTHDNPTFIEEDIIHYCVPNISSVIARTATHAFSNAAFPFIEAIVEQGIEQAIQDDPAIARAIITHKGKILNLARLTTSQQQE
jgi:alanine dehydrogenase